METTITLLGPDLKPVKVKVKFDRPMSLTQETNDKGEVTVQTRFVHDRIEFYVAGRRYEPDNKNITIVLAFHPKKEMTKEIIVIPETKKKSFFRL